MNNQESVRAGMDIAKVYLLNLSINKVTSSIEVPFVPFVLIESKTDPNKKIESFTNAIECIDTNLLFMKLREMIKDKYKKENWYTIVTIDTIKLNNKTSLIIKVQEYNEPGYYYLPYNFVNGEFTCGNEALYMDKLAS